MISRDTSEHPTTDAALPGYPERLLVLHEAAVLLAAQTDPLAAIETVLRAAGRLLGSHSATCYLWDAAAGLLRCAHNWQVPIGDTTPDQRPGEGLAGRAFRSDAPLLVNDYLAWEHARPSGRAAGLRAALAVPLAWGGSRLGVIVMRAYDAGVRFTPDDARLLALFADQAAAALENARLHAAARQELAERERAEVALRASEGRYRLLMEQASDGIFVIEPRGRFLDVNPRACAMLGYEREELLALSPREIMDPAELAARPLDRPAVGGAILLDERLMRRKDGTLFHAEASMKRLPDGRVQAIARDVSERKALEEVSRAGEREARRQAQELTLLDRVRTALVRELDLGTNLGAVLDAVSDTFGGAPVGIALVEGDMLVGLAHEGFGGRPLIIPLTDGVLGRCARTAQAILVPDVRADPDFIGVPGQVGSELCVPLLIGGAVAGVLNVERLTDPQLDHGDLGLLTAIGEQVALAIGRARLHQALAASEARFRALVQHAADGIAIVDRMGLALYHSPAVARITGFSPEELIGTNIFARVHPADDDAARQIFEELTANPGGTRAYDVRIQHADGTWRDLEVRGTNLLDESVVGGLVLNYWDITARKEAEALLAGQSAILEQIARDAPLTETLATLARQLEGVSPGALVAINVLAEAGATLRCVAAPSLPPRFIAEMARIPIHEGSGACGTAAARGEPVIVDDIATDPLCIDFRDVMRAYGLRACWSLPILGRGAAPDDRDRRVIGTVAIYSSASRRPQEAERRAFEHSVGLAALAIERTSATQTLRRSEASLVMAQRIAHLGSWEYDYGQQELRWSDEVFRIAGYAPQAFVPTLERLMANVAPDDREGVRRAFDVVVKQDAPYAFDHRIVRPSGEVRVVHQQAELVRDADGREARLFGIVHDVTERRALEERLAHQAFHDPLTGLPNRALFTDRLGQALAHAERDGKNCVVLFLDIDHFKTVNDSLGHAAGDQLLTSVAARLRLGLRGGDTLARLGGDEFAALLEDIADLAEARDVAARLHATLRAPLVLEGHELFVTASIGLALGEGVADTPEDLLRFADVALYRAKEVGRACTEVFYPGMSAAAVERLELERDLRRALARGEFVVHYQPIVELHTGVIGGLEALVRWQHPTRGLVFPGQFIPLAEETGMIVLIGQWALGEACRQLRAWQDCYPDVPSPTVSVNLSARQFRHIDLVANVAATLAKSGLTARQLQLEVTETVAMADTEVGVTTLATLRALGVRLAIDDFGTGYSSLAYLQRLPVGALKIDRTFFSTGESNRAIVRAITTLAHGLGLEVTAEGLETAPQIAWAREAGCDHGQGYYFARALAPEEFEGWWARGLRCAIPDGAAAAAR